jgi:hypothetical protein
MRLAEWIVITISVAAPAVSVASAPAPRAHSAVAVSLGDGTMNAARLKPYDNAFVVTQIVENGDRIVPGVWTDQLRLRIVNGRQAWVRTQALGYFDGRVISSANAFDPRTFAPISTLLVHPDGSKESWVFGAKDVEGHIIDVKGEETVKHLPPKAAYDFNCCMLSLIPAALPLAAGKSFIVPGFMPGDEATPFRVRSRERVRAGYLGMVDAWRVETPGPGGGVIAFWIADRPPFLVHMTLTGIPGNKNKAGLHYDQSFDMIGAPMAGKPTR